MIKKIVCIIVTVLMIVTGYGKDDTVSAKDDGYESINDLMKACKSESIAVYEANTGTLISGRKENKRRYISHLTKLMTALIVYDTIEAGDIELSTKLKTSEHANSMQGVQIWLDVGEEITVDELVKAITISNANDAAVVLAEGCCTSEESFVKRMNDRAAGLGMKDTVFADCTGISHENVSTAKDMALLAGELARNSVFEEHYKTRIAEVGCKGSQLVAQNRLIGNYKGCVGYKFCDGEEGEMMLCAASKQRDMAVCVVVLGEDDKDAIFSDVKAVMDFAFTHREIYYPEIPEEVLKEIAVEHGREVSCGTEIADSRDIIIERGTYRQIYTRFTREEKLTAPVQKGDKVGELVFYNDTGEILRCTIAAAEDVKEMDMFYAFRCLLYNLFNI